MAKIKIDREKLPALHDYFENDGSTEEADIAEFLGIKNTPEIIAAWEAAYKEYRAEPKVPKVKFRDASGIIRDLEVIREKDGVIYVQDAVVRDLVTVIIKGKPVEVDCEVLRNLPPTTLTEYGCTAGALLSIAEHAR